MFTVGKRTGKAGRRVTGVLAGLVIGATIVAPGTPVQADPGTVGSARDLSHTAGVLPKDKLPKNAVRFHGEHPRPGSYGRAFQKPTAQTRGASPRIVGGTPANAADHPWIIGLQSIFWADDSWWVSTCTGTVLSPTKVLTAGHCTVGLPFGTTYAIAGRNDLDSGSGGFVARVSSAWTHQNFNVAALWNGTANAPIDDVSVLTLLDPLPAAYTPITLTAQGDQAPYAEGTQALIVGYGVTGSNANDSGILRKATVPIQSNATCTSTFGADYDANRMTCAGNPADHIDSCFGDSGGPLIVNGVQAGITDWGPEDCASSYGVYERLSYYSNAVKTDITRPTLVNLDWTGDGHADLMTRSTAGDLVLHSGSGFVNDGFGGIAGSGVVGSEFGSARKLFRVNNWNGDQTPSMMATYPNGDLWQWRTDGTGEWTNPEGERIGTGWGGFTDIMVTNNWLGDGRPNLMGRRSNGDLVLYTSNGQGGWLNPKGTLIGTGWNSFDVVLTPGAWQGDGYQTLIGRNPSNGDLVLFKSNGQGGWFNPKGTIIGSGWNSMKYFLSPGDWNGDNMIDLVGVSPGGVATVYTTNGYGNWINGRGIQFATGWNRYNSVF